MAVSTSESRNVFSCNGVTQAFALTFTFLDSESLVVNKLTTSTGSTSVLVEGTDYTVSGGDGSTGTVSTTSAFSSSFQLIVDRIEPFEQPTVFQKYGAFPAKTVERALDRLTYQIQRLVALSGRVLRQQTADTADIGQLPLKADRLGKVLYFDSTSGDPASTSYTASEIGAGVPAATAASSSAIAASTSAAASASAAAASASAAAASASSISLPLAVASGGTGASTTSAALASLGAEPSDADIIKRDVSTSLSVGYVAVPYANGTISSGSLTPDPANGNIQTYTNNGAHTLVPPTTTSGCSMVLQVTNGASAGTVTTSGFTKVTGSTISTTNGDDFFFFITKVGSFSHLHVQALQ